MILLDNSEYMRNGDYIPTRLAAQKDAANLLVGAKTQAHQESTVGVSAGTELLVSPTDNVGIILNAVHALRTKSMIQDVTSSVQVASLALKHRRNKNGAQRIVLFVGSPLTVDAKSLTKVGKQLKKNNVAIDVVVMGELEENEDRLRELVDAANGRLDDGAERTCHLVTIPAGVLPSDVLASSPIVHGGSGGSAFAASAAAGAAGAGGNDFGGGSFMEYGGVDPNMDPELAMALRVSMEEERARQERMAAQAPQQESKEGDAEMTETAAHNPIAAAMEMGLSEEEALLQQALAMSMNENESKEDDSKPSVDAMDTEDVDDEAAAMQIALQMSMQAEEEAKSGEGGDQGQDPQFVNDLLGNIPGVDPNDPAIQSALRNLNQGSDNKEGEKKGEDSKE
jgi:26S proteasome regulatory subunit N10